MYLSDRDLEFAVRTGQLIVNPPPRDYDTTSIDLHLGPVEEAKIWDVAAFEKQQSDAGIEPILGLGRFDHDAFAKQFHRPVPENPAEKVYREGKKIILKPGGFFLWLTQEQVGTPEENPRLICFVDGKSSRARVGLVVHMTAPTIHAGWWGQVTLEIANLGPFTIALKEGDTMAQIVVAAISSPPAKRKSATIKIGQKNVAGGDTATGA